MLSPAAGKPAVLKDRILDAVTVAKKEAIDQQADGLIVLDAENEVTYYNQRAGELLPLNDRQNHTAILDRLDNCILEKQTIEGIGKIFEVISKLITKDMAYMGKMYVLNDIQQCNQVYRAWLCQIAHAHGTDTGR